MVYVTQFCWQLVSRSICSCSQAVSKIVWHIPLLCLQWKKTPDDGQRNCPKHVDFHSKNKFEKFVHLVGFIIRKLKILYSVPFYTIRTETAVISISSLQRFLFQMVRDCILVEVLTEAHRFLTMVARERCQQHLQELPHCHKHSTQPNTFNIHGSVHRSMT